MIEVRDAFYFVHVVDRGGFTPASKSLRVPISTLSHRIRQLEAALGVRLIHRTSRRFGMTDLGVEFYQYASELVRAADAAQEVVRQRLSEPSGTIRITTAVEIAQFALRDLIPKFLNRHPKVRIIEIATDRLVDIVGEGFDLALRGHVADLKDSSLVQRAIAKVPWLLFASRKYLEGHRHINDPADLAGHSTLSMDRHGTESWDLFHSSGRQVSVPIEPRFLSNNMIALKEAACADLGVVAIPGYICRREVEAGQLRQVLPAWIAADAKMSALIPYRTGVLPAVRLLVDFLAAEVPKATNFQ